MYPSRACPDGSKLSFLRVCSCPCPASAVHAWGYFVVPATIVGAAVVGATNVDAAIFEVPLVGAAVVLVAHADPAPIVDAAIELCAIVEAPVVLEAFAAVVVVMFEVGAAVVVALPVVGAAIMLEAVVVFRSSALKSCWKCSLTKVGEPHPARHRNRSTNVEPASIVATSSARASGADASNVMVASAMRLIILRSAT